MLLRDTPIRRKLMTILLLTSGAVLLLTCVTFFAYEFVTFRQTTVRQLSTLGKVIADNSTAALAYQNQNDAKEILASLKAEHHIVAASLYDKEGKLFSKYPEDLPVNALPAAPDKDGYRFESSYLVAFQPVVQGANKRLGTLYLKSDRAAAMYERFRPYGGIVALVIAISFLLAYLLSRALQKQISQPILALADTAKAISERRDYSVRANKFGEDEVGHLTDAFNQMLAEIQEQSQDVQKLASIVQSSEDAIISKTLDGKITSWNRGAEKVFGYSVEEAVGKSMRMLFPPERAKEEPEIISRITRGESIDHFETQRIRKDGRKIDVSVTISPIKNSRGEIIGASNIARDITDRKRAEEEIHELNAKLEQRVQERTAQLEEANKELEAFSYSVSHDLRAPIRHINGFVDLLGKHSAKALDEKGVRYLEFITSSARKMGELVDDLLGFSRMARAELHHTRVNLQQLAEEVRRDLRADEAGRAVEWQIDPLPEVHADPSMLRLVLVNLLSNAVKYSRARNPAQIQVGAHTNDKEHIVFVRDNGAGFDMKYASKLFGVFQRLHREEEFEGTGIGLANVHRIIRRHRGRVWAEGKEDEGATFYFALPKLADATPETLNQPT